MLFCLLADWKDGGAPSYGAGAILWAAL